MRRVWSAGSAPGGAHSSTGPLASGREVGEVSDDGRGMGLRSRVRYLTPLAGGEGNWTTIGAVNGEGQSQTGTPWFVQTFLRAASCEQLLAARRRLRAGLLAPRCCLRLVAVMPSGGEESPDRVIPSGAAQRRRRGIAIIPVDGPPGRDDGDSSPPPALRAGSARNDKYATGAPLGMTSTQPALRSE